VTGVVFYTTTHRSDYDRLCDLVKRVGGQIRLTVDEGDAVAITITVPQKERDGEETRAIGFVFGALDDLAEHAAIALWWLYVLGAPAALMSPPRLPEFLQ
jgi:hypothetical protein